MSNFNSDTTSTGPIHVHADQEQDSSTFNLVACSLAVGSAGFAFVSSLFTAPVAVAFALVAMTMSILGVATGRRYAWAGWVGAIVAGGAVVLAWLAITGEPLPVPA